MTKVTVSYLHHDESRADWVKTALLPTGGLTVELHEVSAPAQASDWLPGGASPEYLLPIVSATTLPFFSPAWDSLMVARRITVLPVHQDAVELPEPLRRRLHFVLRPPAELRPLQEFFAAEHGPALPRTRSSDPLLGKATRREIRIVTTSCISEEGFLSFVLDAGIEPDSIPGRHLGEKLLHLLHSLNRQGLLERFAAWLSRETLHRPCILRTLEKLRATDDWTWE